ncbi:MAG: single-stranded DNA-binding protein [Cyanobacteria bacterium RM1_2_2]|nr:single-stranded DNA-binding protein [Cyanobacteria bacterium RM1_2_2]
MNSCILMAEVIQDPQLRFTPDNQTPIAEMWVQFAGLREDEPPAKLKVVGWGNLAQEIQERYHVGDRVIIEGRLHMNTVERQEGFKEKRAELTAQKVYLLGADASVSMIASTPAVPAASSATKPAVASEAPASKPPSNKPPAASKPPAAKVPAYSAPPAADPVDYDEIPF